jgi:hypothetical protein
MPYFNISFVFLTGIVLPHTYDLVKSWNKTNLPGVRQILQIFYQDYY